ncbi:MAG TPA: hypothetical protein PKC20_15010, partial [Burkholderiaceae bacterium]|nr:hypothetical protein [Burkholderiaceae bacterium]
MTERRASARGAGATPIGATGRGAPGLGARCAAAVLSFARAGVLGLGLAFAALGPGAIGSARAQPGADR